VWWRKPLIPALGRQRQEDFKASLVSKVSSRTARATQRNPVSEKKKVAFHARENSKRLRMSTALLEDKTLVLSPY
jgi:hypothetical protein